VSDEHKNQSEEMQGREKLAVPDGPTPSHERPSFADPVPGNIDPTDPESPEQTVEHNGPAPKRTTGDRE